MRRKRLIRDNALESKSFRLSLLIAWWTKLSQLAAEAGESRQ